MFIEITSGGKLSATNRALMSTLTSMTHHVLAQSIWTHEFLATS
jgi:hypothetical protein